jgi:hypothetical protein
MMDISGNPTTRFRGISTTNKKNVIIQIALKALFSMLNSADEPTSLFHIEI